MNKSDHAEEKAVAKNDSKILIIMESSVSPEILSARIAELKKQRNQEWEMLVFQDANTGIGCHYQDVVGLDERVHFVEITEGQSESNRMIQQMKEMPSSYVLFWGNRAAIEPDFLEKALKKANDKKADLVIFSPVCEDSQGYKINGVNLRKDLLPKERRWFCREDIPDDILLIPSVTSKEFLVRTELISENDWIIKGSKGYHFTAMLLAALLISKRTVCSDDIPYKSTIMTMGIKDSASMVMAVQETEKETGRIGVECKEAFRRWILRYMILCFVRSCRKLSDEASQSFYRMMREVLSDPEYRETLRNIPDHLVQEWGEILLNQDEASLTQRGQQDLTVSLTTYPARIKYASSAIRSVLEQTVKPDRIIICLCKGEFPGREKDLPAELMTMIQEEQIQILWTEDNLKPHKKWIEAMTAYADDIIITLDDDLIYRPDLLERLLRSYYCFPEAVSASRTHLMVTDEQALLPYSYWLHEQQCVVRQPSMQLLVTGGAGALYPPRLFESIHETVFNREAIKELCLCQDDLWLKAMELLAGVPVAALPERDGLHYVPGSQDVSLWKQNREETSENETTNDLVWKQIIMWVEARFGKGKIGEAFRNEQYKDGQFSISLLAQEYLKLKQSLKDDGIGTEARLDLKIPGEEGNYIEVVSSSDEKMKVGCPPWMSTKDGDGIVIESRKGDLDLLLQCHGTGELNLHLRGKGVKTDKGQMLPYLTDYIYFAFQDEVIFNQSTVVWHNKPYKIQFPVTDGQTIRIRLKWRPLEIHSDYETGKLFEFTGNAVAKERQSSTMNGEKLSKPEDLETGMQRKGNGILSSADQQISSKGDRWRWWKKPAK